jgi:hypothetical protein
LRAQGELEEALAALRRANKLASPGSAVARDLPALIGKVEHELAK